MSKTLIIIDDDHDDLDIMREAVASVDPLIECITYSEPVAAIDALLTDKSNIPDYIFIDLNMPRMKGDECLRLLREAPQMKDVCITIISTYMSDVHSQKLREEGATYTVEKPSTGIAYHTLLKSIFRNHR